MGVEGVVGGGGGAWLVDPCFTMAGHGRRCLSMAAHGRSWPTMPAQEANRWSHGLLAVATSVSKVSWHQSTMASKYHGFLKG